MGSHMFVVGTVFVELIEGCLAYPELWVEGTYGEPEGLEPVDSCGVLSVYYIGHNGELEGDTVNPLSPILYQALGIAGYLGGTH